MRSHLFLAMILATSLSAQVKPDAPAPAPKVKAAAARIAQVEWITGTWIGQAGDMTIEERWTPAASGAILGIGRTLQGARMAGFEFLRITERDGSLVYAAMPNGRSPATPFTLTSITPDTATFENPSHDYPKLVRYSRLPDGSLQTTISAGGDVNAQSVVLKKQ
ncbi:MAG: DUF6265 family protein [Vicinamibacterales bacterium]